jgi:hypothetical protein
VNERSSLDRFLAAVPVAVVGLGLLALFFWEASTRKTPTIFTDELEWSQISRAIASTGHAARRGDPIGFKSLYPYFIAPTWWIQSTKTAYSAAKYLDTLAMCLTAIPVYFTAKLMVPRRVALLAGFASICTSALFYAGFLIPEPLAYPVFAVTAYAGIRALAGGGRRWIVAAVVLGLIGMLVRNELSVALATLGLAAAILWVVGPRGQKLRTGWSVADHIGAGILLVGALIVANTLASPHVTQWNVVTGTWQGRMWTLGLTSTAALAIGLGVLPMITGLASLWIPERRHDPAWRAFAAYTGSAILFFWLYTAVKAAYLSTQVFTRIEERNLIYLGPLLIVGTVVYFCSKPWLPGLVAAAAITTFLVLYYGYQLDDPYFESPGYGIAAFANRNLGWDQHDIRIALAVTCVACLLAALIPLARRLRPLLVVVTALVLAWMLTGQITVAQGAAAGSRALLANFVSPPDFVDRETNRAGTTFMGQNLSAGQDVGVWLLEFWNRSVKNIWTLDGSAPGPGLTTTPDLTARDGRLSSDPFLPYVIATNGVDLIGKIVDSRPNLQLLRLTTRPWRLKQSFYGRSDDGWITGANGDATSADGTYAYFGPETKPGILTLNVRRSGFCHDSPGTNATVTVGPVALNEQRAPVVDHPTYVKRFHVADCSNNVIRVKVRPPVAAQVHVTPLTLGTDYGVPDSREFGVQLDAAFTPSKGS